MSEVQIGVERILLCNVNDTIFALDGICPHQGAALAHGAIHDHTIVCPWHGWEFDCRTGRGDCATLRTYPVTVAGGAIWLHA